MFHLNIETAVHIRLYTLLVTLQSYNGQAKKPKTKTSVSFNNLALQSQPNGWIYKMIVSLEKALPKEGTPGGVTLPSMLHASR